MRKEDGVSLAGFLVFLILVLVLIGVGIVVYFSRDTILDKIMGTKQEVLENQVEEDEEDDEYEEESEEDYVALEQLANTTNDGLMSLDSMPIEIYESDTVYKDENGNSITIPKGFGILRDSTTDPLSLRDTVEEGFVIVDDKANQFVWIPADSENIAVQMLIESEELYKSTVNENFIEPAVLSGYDGTSLDIGSYKTTIDILTDEYTKMRDSVINREGFYVARFEMALGSDQTALSKKKSTVTTSKSEATKSWYGLHEAAKTYENEDVVSMMISNSQWDIIMNWISGVDSRKITGRNESETVTGGTSSDKINNIYDLIGGRREWTTAIGEMGYRVYRGGYYGDSKSADNAGNDMDVTLGVDLIGTRIVLIW